MGKFNKTNGQLIKKTGIDYVKITIPELGYVFNFNVSHMSRLNREKKRVEYIKAFRTMEVMNCE